MAGIPEWDKSRFVLFANLRTIHEWDYPTREFDDLIGCALEITTMLQFLDRTNFVPFVNICTIREILYHS